MTLPSIYSKDSFLFLYAGNASLAPRTCHAFWALIRYLPVFLTPGSCYVLLQHLSPHDFVPRFWPPVRPSTSLIKHLPFPRYTFTFVSHRSLAPPKSCVGCWAGRRETQGWKRPFLPELRETALGVHGTAVVRASQAAEPCSRAVGKVHSWL